MVPTVIPIITTVLASTLGEKLAPKESLETAVPLQSATTSATDSSTTQVQQIDDTGQIIKAMEEMSLKNNEINSLKKTIQSLESSNKNALITTKGHEQRANRLE